jgi:hypothetical protein
MAPPAAPIAAPRAPPRTTERPPAIADWDVLLPVVPWLGAFGLYPDCEVAHSWHCIWFADACWGFVPGGGYA